MLPTNLLSSYQQYKNDTDTIASWLATTAKARGYVSETKSANRKKKKGKSAQTSTQLPQGRKTYTVAIKEFTTLAEFLVKVDEPPVRVPPRFAALLDRAIATRQWFSNAIAPHIPGDARKELDSDDRHAFFLGILKKVRDILDPRLPKGDRPSKKAPQSFKDVTNMFENLDLEEPSEAFNQAPDIAVAPDNKASEVDYKAERVMMDSLMESYLAFQFLLSDLNNLRTEVSRSWHGYKEGFIDLVAASITTNTAVDLARAMEEDLKDLLAEHGGTEQMLPVFYMSQCIEAGTTEAYRERLGDEINYKMWDLANSMFWPAFFLLSSFSDVIEPGLLPELKAGHFGTYDPSSDRSKKSNREKLNEDKIILLEILPEFMIMCNHVEPAPAEDELTRGLRIYFETKKIPLWLAFATTLWLDIHHILRDEADFAFKRLADTADFARANIKNTLEFHENLRVDTWPPQNDLLMNRFSEEIKHWIQSEPYRRAAMKLKRVYMKKPYYMFRQHPWSCGLWKYHIQVRLLELGVTFANAWGSIMYCGHLYNALENEKLISNHWKDLELVLFAQGPKFFFAGDAPTSPEDYLKRFALAVGISAMELTKGSKRKTKGIIKSKRGPQGLKELAVVLHTFKERYCDTNSRLDLRTEDVEKILANSDWEYEMNADGLPETLFKDTEPEPGVKKTIPKKLPVAKLLALLRATLHAEMLELTFDYLTLHRFCWRLLRSVKDHCRDRLIKCYGPDYIEKESQLPFVVGYIFMTATDSDRLADVLKIKKTHTVTSAVLKEAGDAVQGMLESGGGEIVSDIMETKFGVDVQIEI